MNKNIIITNNELMSLNDYGNFNFPITFCKNFFDTLNSNQINLHWHKQIEFSYVVSGTVRYVVADKEITLHTGDALFINSNVLHAVKSSKKNDKAILFSIIFDYSMLSFGTQSSIFSKYVAPFVQNDNLPFFLINRTTLSHSNLLSNLSYLYRLSFSPEKPSFGYELDIQNKLGEIWLSLVIHFTEETNNIGKINLQTQKRLKNMILFIQEKYMDRINLNDIAYSANVSKSECIRCFKEITETTPINYLIGYRLSQSLLLLQKTDLSIQQISCKCGFEDSSYFTRTFKARIGITPREYRLLSYNIK